MPTGWLCACLCQSSVLLSTVPWLFLCWLGSSGFKAEETVAEGGQFPAREAAAEESLVRGQRWLRGHWRAVLLHK